MTAKKRKSQLKYGVAPSAQAVLDEREAQIAGRELRKIAEAHQVGDIRALDKRLVFEVIEADPKHPMRALRAYGGWDKDDAARRHWIDVTGKIIAGLRIIRLNLKGKVVDVRPQFLYVPPPEVRKGEERSRSRVLAEDVYAHNPQYVSALAAQVKLIDSAVKRLEHIVSNGPAPVEVGTLSHDLRAALTTYMDGVNAVSDAAE